MPIVIENDMGGAIIEYVQRYKRPEDLVVVDGRCASACTLVLALPDGRVCVTKRALFGFHQATNLDGEPSFEGTNQLMSAYPEWVRAWIRQRGGLKEAIMWMTRGVIGDHLPRCEKNSVSHDSH